MATLLATLLHENMCLTCSHKMLSYRREAALQGAYVLANSERLELGDSSLRTV